MPARPAARRSRGPRPLRCGTTVRTRRNLRWTSTSRPTGANHSPRRSPGAAGGRGRVRWSRRRGSLSAGRLSPPRRCARTCINPAARLRARAARPSSLRIAFAGALETGDLLAVADRAPARAHDRAVGLLDPEPIFSCRRPSAEQLLVATRRRAASARVRTAPVSRSPPPALLGLPPIRRTRGATDPPSPPSSSPAAHSSSPAGLPALQPVGLDRLVPAPHGPPRWRRPDRRPLQQPPCAGQLAAAAWSAPGAKLPAARALRPVRRQSSRRPAAQRGTRTRACRGPEKAYSEPRLLREATTHGAPPRRRVS
jgi:hypothetical protein